MRLALALLATFAIALVACNGDGDTEDTMEETPTAEPPTVQITDIVVGTGQTVEAGDAITVHYTGRLEDGTEFGSSVGGEPLVSALEGLIPGWQEGIPGMKVGGKRTPVIPPELAYGDVERSGIPPNSTLTFDIELLSIQ